MGLWDFGTIGHSNHRTLGPLDHVDMGLWDYLTLGFSDHGTFGFQLLWGLQFFRITSFGELSVLVIFFSGDLNSLEPLHSEIYPRQNISMQAKSKGLLGLNGWITENGINRQPNYITAVISILLAEMCLRIFCQYRQEGKYSGPTCWP